MLVSAPDREERASGTGDDAEDVLLALLKVDADAPPAEPNGVGQWRSHSR
jgi:hypothetical protein